MAGKIEGVTLRFDREPLVQPFGFKGGYLDELWQSFCEIRTADGKSGAGRGVQSVLWADAVTFAAHSQAGANAMMLTVTEKALCLLKGREFTNPCDLIHAIFPECYDYASRVTGNDRLPATFVLNALVPVDFALWQIAAAEGGLRDFSHLMSRFSPSMDQRHEKLGAIPLISYNTGEDEVEALLREGIFLLKIKIGANPGGRNDLEEMCRWDVERIRRIHEIAARYETPYTDCGHPVYYLDANGRYDGRERLEEFLKGAEDCGALERIVLLEEPFCEESGICVRGLPVRIAGDESIHSAEDAVRCIDELGYGAVALKPIAKTLSATFEIYEQAAKRNIPCFCADLTVPPAMLEWNMQVAARIGTIPGLRTGVVESNGAQNYRNWEDLLRRTGHPDAGWLHPQGGVFDLTDFYTQCNVLQHGG